VALHDPTSHAVIRSCDYLSSVCRVVTHMKMHGVFPFRIGSWCVMVCRVGFFEYLRLHSTLGKSIPARQVDRQADGRLIHLRP